MSRTDRRDTSGPPTAAGLVLSPFPGIRYDATVVGRLDAVLAPPYDVIDATEVHALKAASPWNITHLTRPDSYEEAGRLFRSWLDGGALRSDEPCLYAYENQPVDGPAVRGLLGSLQLSPAEAGFVLPHENVLSGPVADRLAVMQAVGGDLEPIFLVYDGGGATDSVLTDALAQPLLDAATPDGARHRLAAIDDAVTLEFLAGHLVTRRALIADGHHRHATYLARQAERWSVGGVPGPWDGGLAFLVDGSLPGLDVRAIHRVLPELDYGQALSRARAVATVRPLMSGDPGRWTSELAAAARPAFVLASGAEAALVTGLPSAAVDAAVPRGHGDAWRSLDVAVFAHYLLPVVLGITDGDGYDEHDPARAAQRASAGGGTAVLLPPVGFADVLAVAEQGDRMPRKSTLFVPKPASGLVLRSV